MKKILCVGLIALAAAWPAFGIDSSVVKNTTNGQVFAVSYESGVATVTVAGVVSATTLSGSSLTAPAATLGTATVQTNLTVSGRITAATINQVTVSTNLTVLGAGIVGGTMAVSNTLTISATAAKFLAGTNVGVSAQVSLGTNLVNIVNGIITATGL